MSRIASELDFTDFHQQELPRLLIQGGNARAAAAAAGLPALALKLAGGNESYTYCPGTGAEAGTIELSAGCEQAATVIELDRALWQGLAADLETVPGLIYGDRLSAGSHGDMGVFSRWEPVLRSIYHDMPICDPDNLEVRDSQGRILDPQQSFTLADDPDTMREFFNGAGYLLINKVFDEAELAVFRKQAQELRDEAREDDRASWWGKNSQGDAVCTRVLAAVRKPAFAKIYDDPRIRQLQQLVPPGLEPRYNSEEGELDGVTVVYKTPHMKEGLSDLPWHRDCGMGGHAIMCPAVNVSIYLVDATAERGELRFLPGSHKTSCGNLDGKTHFGVGVAALAGSVTLHYTDVMHAAPEPTGTEAPYRSSVLLGFARIKGTHRGERHYNDVLFRNEDGQIDHMDSLLVER